MIGVYILYADYMNLAIQAFLFSYDPPVLDTLAYGIFASLYRMKGKMFANEFA